LDDGDCGNPTPLCNTTSHACVQCLTNADCAEGGTCDPGSGQCQ
jgi:Cys-rich repeat protein